MPDSTAHERKRDDLRRRYLTVEEPTAAPVAPDTDGVDHLALISSDLEATIRFYTEVLNMRLVKVVPNRDEPTSTHIFLDMGGGNLLAFFDFPAHGPARTVRGVGSMHHLALKATPANYQALLGRLEACGLEYSVHGDSSRGSVYLRDPDGIQVEVTTGY